MTTYIFDVVGIVLVAATLPVVLELALLTLAFALPRRRRSPANRSSVRLGVIIPAHNEEALIGRCVKSLRDAAGTSGTRIIAIAHNCSDHTAQRAFEAGAEVMVYDDPKAVGKGFALLYGFDHALAEDAGMDAVLVVDADSTVSANLIDTVRASLADGAEAVQCRYEMDSTRKRPKTRLTALAFRGFNYIRASGRDRLGLSSGIQGNGFAVRRAVLSQQPYGALSVVEDLEYHLQLVIAGRKVKFLDQAIVSSELPLSAQGETTQRSRWEGGRASVARIWLGPLLRQVMGGRLRLLEPMLDVASLPIGYAAFLVVLALAFPLEWLRLYAAAAIVVMAAHILTAAWAGPDFAGDLRVLTRVPAYIFWKLRVLPELLHKSGAKAVWVRTERDMVPVKAALQKAPGISG